MLSTKDILARRLPVSPNDYLDGSSVVSTSTRDLHTHADIHHDNISQEPSLAVLRNSEASSWLPTKSISTAENIRRRARTNRVDTLTQLQHDRVLRERAHLRQQYMHLQTQNESLRGQLKHARDMQQQRTLHNECQVRMLEQENASLKDAIGAKQRGFKDIESTSVVEHAGTSRGAIEGRPNMVIRHMENEDHERCEDQQKQLQKHQNENDEKVKHDDNECMCSDCAVKDDQLRAAMHKIQDLHSQLNSEHKAHQATRQQTRSEQRTIAGSREEEQQYDEEEAKEASDGRSSDSTTNTPCALDPTIIKAEPDPTPALLALGGVLGWARREVNFRVPTENILHEVLRDVHEGILELSCDLGASVNSLCDFDRWNSSLIAAPSATSSCYISVEPQRDLQVCRRIKGGQANGRSRGNSAAPVSSLSSSAWGAFQIRHDQRRR